MQWNLSRLVPEAAAEDATKATDWHLGRHGASQPGSILDADTLRIFADFASFKAVF